MKRYTVTLTGNNKVVIDDKQKREIEAAKLSGENYFITVGDNSFETGSVKLITPILEDDISGFDDKMRSDSKLFFDGLRMKQGIEPMEKAKREWQIRIAPGLKLAGITLEKRYEQIIKHFIVDFVTENGEWPYCKMQVWWAWVSYAIKKQRPMASKWFEYVMRQDSQVQYFMNSQSK